MASERQRQAGTDAADQVRLGFCGELRRARHGLQVPALALHMARTPAEQVAAARRGQPKPVVEPKGSCVPTAWVQRIGFSKTKYPTIRQHVLKAVARGWPRILVLNRPGASGRRARLLADIPTRDGYDHDEYPPAVARGRGFHIRGADPRGWKADVAYVRSSENRSHGSTMGIKLRRFCDGQKFRYLFY